VNGGFVPGLRLSEMFFREAVQPILEGRFPGLPYSAGLMGTGSEVLGYDTPLSMDHAWGPRVILFLGAGDVSIYKEEIAMPTCARG